MLEGPDEKPLTPITPCTKEFLASLLPSDNALVSLNSGVPTRTTATLTPTTLRNIEQTYIELQCQVESHQNQARFVPPVVPPNQGMLMNVVDLKRWQGGSTRISEARPMSVNLPSSKSSSPTQPKRNAGGRKPNKELDISPEEEERRAVRRERNKMAAARCRKRRLDHTNELIEETEELEEKKSQLQSEIQQLQLEKKELEYLLESHKPCCRLNPPPAPSSPPDVKPRIDDQGQVVAVVTVEPEIICKKPTNIGVSKFSQNAISRSNLGGSKRPDSLAVFPGSVTTADGVPITTPTNGIPFNFESLMEGGTGLTPVSGPLIPSCSTQQRNSDLSSPDSNKLVSL